MINDKLNSFKRIYAIVKTIPLGRVMTYGEVAKKANVATPRIVGFALHVNSDPKNIPCHRVVFADGSLSKGYIFGGEGEQKKKLLQEGVKFLQNGRVEKTSFYFHER